MVALNFGDKCGFTTHGKKVQVLGAFVKDLSVIVLSAEAMTQMCLGAVNGGVKFW
jgi:hypothetical protein